MTGSHIGAAPLHEDREGGWLPLFNALLRRRVMIARVTTVVFLAVVLITLVLPRKYTATAAFMPQSPSSSLGQLAGLAAQFGLSAPTGGLGTNPEFYADLLRSGPILRAVVEHKYDLFEREPSHGTLADYYEVRESSEPRRVAAAVRILRTHLSVRTDPKTAVVKLAVDARSPGLAKAIMERLLEEVNRFNLDSRQSQAGQERRFIEERLGSAREELRSSENELERFLVRNREYRNAPQLLFQYDRLQREVGMRQQVYTTLVQAYEQARIEEVRNTPVITLVERPIAPPIPDRRYLLLKAIVAVVGGLLAGGAWAILGELFRDSGQREPRAAEEFHQLVADARRDLRTPWRLLGPSRFWAGGRRPG